MNLEELTKTFFWCFQIVKTNSSSPWVKVIDFRKTRRDLYFTNVAVILKGTHIEKLYVLFV